MTVHEAYVHCNKAIRRSSLWDTNNWLPNDELPVAAEMFKAHAADGLQDVSVEELHSALDEDAKATMWVPGGE